MLKDSFYNIISFDRGDGGAVAEIALNPAHDIYKAHFPGYPITPGVCIVQIALELMSECAGRDLVLVGAKDIKFLVPVEPGTSPRLTFTITGSSVVVSHDDTVFAKMNLDIE